MYLGHAFFLFSTFSCQYKMNPEDPQCAVIDTKDTLARSIRSSFVNDGRRVAEALRWKNVNASMSIREQDTSNRFTSYFCRRTRQKLLLQNVWGEAMPNQTTALMGASGAGKTTLLNVLAGRTSRSINILGDIFYGYANVETLPGGIHKFRQSIAFVPQEDVVHNWSTPREAIKFSAKMRLPTSTSDIDMNDLVSDYLNKLGLQKCADTIIGSGLKRGISGGEKKRTSIGIELVTDPGIIFLDEPTSGLDAVSTVDLLNLLDSLAEAGNVVIFTVHQPSSSAFLRFDNVIVLSEGRLMYHGKSVDVLHYFDNIGFPVPEFTNPADWVLMVTQSHSFEELNSAGLFPTDIRTWCDSRPMRLSYITEFPKTARGRSFLHQLYQILSRDLMTLKRNPGAIVVDALLTHLVIGFLTGAFFYKVGSALESNYAGALGALTSAVALSYNYTLIAQALLRLSSLARQRPLFLKEYFTGTYSVAAYLAANTAMEILTISISELPFTIVIYYLYGLQFGFGWFYLITFLVAANSSSVAFLAGSFFTDSDIVQTLLIVMVQPQLTYSGLFIPVLFIPIWIRWLTRILYMRYATALTDVYMFGPCASKDSTGNNACNQLLKTNNVSIEDVGLYWLGFVAILIGTRFLGFLVFKIRATLYS